jgi:hypothetical protein
MPMPERGVAENDDEKLEECQNLPPFTYTPKFKLPLNLLLRSGTINDN